MDTTLDRERAAVYLTDDRDHSTASYDVSKTLMLGHIDPTLESLYSPSPMASQWTSREPLQQYLGDSQTSALFALAQAAQPFHHGSSGGRPVPPMPPAPQPRYGSPFSYHDPSTCSSALSPPGDNESYHEGNTPSTPSDYNSMPPSSLLKGIYVGHASHHHPNVFRFAGGAVEMPSDGCVNPFQVNPSQEPLMDISSNESNSFDYGSLQRADSCYSFTSHHDMMYRNPQSSTDYETKHPSSPEELVSPIKDEIRIPDTMPSMYPSPDAQDGDESSAEGTNPRKTKREDLDDDDDYKPNRRPAKRRLQQQPALLPRKQQSRARNMRPSPQPLSTDAHHRKPIAVHHYQVPALSPKTAAPPSAAATSGPGLSCTECRSERFRDAAELHRHMHHKHDRAYRCIFDFAGCLSTFGSKNEWKRHVMSQHIVLVYWLCTQGACADVVNSADALPRGSVFNRKDLYTQHLRRMHSPPGIKVATRASAAAAGSGSGKKQKKSAAAPEVQATTASQAEVQAYEDSLKRWQEKAETRRCGLPMRMGCPSRGCGQVFEGSEAWGLRMEHVAKHLQREGKGTEEMGRVRFGGAGDEALVEWAGSRDVGVIRRVGGGGDGQGRWVLSSRLNSAGGVGGESFAGGAGSGAGPGASRGSRGGRVVPRMLAASLPSSLGTVVVGGGEDVDAEGEDE